MSFYKSFVIAGLLATSAVQAHTHKHTSTQAPFKGGYGGLQGGLAHLKTKVDVDFGNFNNDFSAQNLSDVSGGGGLHLGWYLPYQERWVFGLEARGELFALSAEEKTAVNLATLAQVRYKYEERYNVGLAAQVGYRIQRGSLVYLKLGARLSEFKFTYQDITNGVGSPSYSQTKTKVGFEPGLGARFILNRSKHHRGYWSAFGEYSYTFYGSNTFDNMDNSGGDRFPTASIRPEIGRFSLGVSYHF